MKEITSTAGAKMILICVGVMALLMLPAGTGQVAAAPTVGYGQSDTVPETYVKTLGMVQVRYNVRQVTVTDPDGKTRTAYGYDWHNIPKLDLAEIEKALPPKTVEDLKALPLKTGIEKVSGYNNMDKAAYEAKFNTVEEEKP